MPASIVDAVKPRVVKTMETILAYRLKHGDVPTIAALAVERRVTETTVCRHLLALLEAGYIDTTSEPTNDWHES
jgi:predicted ArsR family transcriptional regulator